MCINGLFFFFQAEDGIRDDLVTGVQTCALPIYPRLRLARRPPEELGEEPVRHGEAVVVREVLHVQLERAVFVQVRSEERRVGKSVDLGGRRIIKKKKKRAGCTTTCDDRNSECL